MSTTLPNTTLTIKPAWPRMLVATVLCVALLVLLGWQLNIEILKRPLPGLVAMNPTTAFCFLLLSVSLLLAGYQGSRFAKQWLVYVLCGIVLAIGLLKGVSLLIGYMLPVDQFIFGAKLKGPTPNTPVNQMALNTCIGFTVAAMAAIATTQGSHLLKALANYLVLPLFFFSVFPLLGYIYGVTEFYGILAHLPMAVHTAVSFILLGFAILLYNPVHGYMKQFTSVFMGGKVARLLMPYVFVVPLCLGFTRLFTNRLWPVSVELGVAMLITAIIFSFFFLTWFVVTALNKSDARRYQVEQELKASVANLREANSQLQAANDEIAEKKIHYDHAHDMLCTANMDGYFINVNRSFTRELGYTEQELQQDPFLTFVHPDDVPATLKEMEKLAAGGTTLNFENRYLCKNGEYKWLQWNTIVHKGLLYATARNITEKKLHTEEIERQSILLQQANAELDSFTYSVSHDLRAPLRGVHGYAQILEEDYGNLFDQEGNRILGNIMASAKKMGVLIDDLLAFSRLGRKELAKSTVNMGEMVQHIWHDINVRENGRRVDLKLHPIPACVADMATIKQVWVNLLSNAVKYSRNQPTAEVVVGATENEDGIVYYVKDNGVGFDMIYANKLFGVFQRLHAEEDFEGTGVGLAIVHRVIHKHGGSVWAESKPAQGATFYFLIPKQ